MSAETITDHWPLGVRTSQSCRAYAAHGHVAGSARRRPAVASFREREPGNEARLAADGWSDGSKCNYHAVHVWGRGLAESIKLVEGRRASSAQSKNGSLTVNNFN